MPIVINPYRHTGGTLGAAPTWGNTATTSTSGSTPPVSIPAHNNGDVVIAASRIGPATVSSVATTNGASWTYTTHTLGDSDVLLLMWLRAIANQATETTVTVTLSTARAVVGRSVAAAGVGADPSGFGTIATGTSISPNPPEVALGGTVNASFWAVASWPVAENALLAPASYTDLGNRNGFTRAVATARRSINSVSSENPGAFTIPTSSLWAAATIGLPGTVS